MSLLSWKRLAHSRNYRAVTFTQLSTFFVEAKGCSLSGFPFPIIRMCFVFCCQREIANSLGFSFALYFPFPFSFSHKENGEIRLRAIL